MCRVNHNVLVFCRLIFVYPRAAEGEVCVVLLHAFEPLVNAQFKVAAAYPSVVPFPIVALLAGKGYDLMHGKRGKGKIAIVLVMSILGVVLGTFGGYFAEIVKEIVSGGFPGYTIAQAPGMIVTLLTLSEEFCSEFVRNLGLGFLFAALGIYMELRNEHRQLKGMSVKELP